MIKVVIWGFGDIANLLLEHLPSYWEIIGIVDVDPTKTGKQVLSLKVSHPYEIDLQALKPDVIIHTAGTFLDRFKEDFINFIEAKVNVVTTAETMAWPWYRYKDIADKVDTLARERGVSILPVGVNPGFIFDALPLILTYPALEVDEIILRRKVNAYRRRGAFQKKYGIGLKEAEFYKGQKEGWITGHVGYEESILSLSDALGWELSSLESFQVPILFEDKVIGLRGEATGVTADGRRISLTLLALEEDEDEIILKGTPSYHWKALGGVHGDLATVSAVINGVNLITQDQVPHGIVTLRYLVKLRNRRRT